MKKTKLITSLTVASALVMGSVVPAFAYSKEETVYTKLKTNGTEKTTVVSQHLINDQKETILEDQTTLTNVKNMNGKETFKQNGETITWQTSDGQDIYYQGKTKASLPISMKVTYKLDGQKMKLKEMLGKKGKVEIKIDYTNNETKTVDGKELYVPFVVIQEQCFQPTMLLMLKLQMEKSSVMVHQILSWRLPHQVYQKTTIIIMT